MRKKTQEKPEAPARSRSQEHGSKRPKLTKSDFNQIKLTENQHKFFCSVRDNDITVCTGDAGTAKTFVGCYAALDLLKEGKIDRIILSRPIVESGENLGFLPGTIEEKTGPYMEGFISNMEKIIDTVTLAVLLQTKVIDVQPLAYMRGKTYDRSLILLDEMQNADLRQIMLAVTRMGKDSKVVICGDTTQWDIKNRRKDLLTFADVMLKGVDKCSAFQFGREDIVRNPILIKLTDNYEAYKGEHGLDK